MLLDTDRYQITTEPNNIVVRIKVKRQDSRLLEDKSRIGEIMLGEKRFFPNLEKAFAWLAKSQRACLMMPSRLLTSSGT
ncbi:hypothetical protein JCM19232_4731 [Vibrio ishigakensis]|uniref:Uncharacterized protein n=1 Tax=Vibrio ishigakensis TaxID=1481914 RepID=A0A0B8PJZ3_9VIBR|nr:hypothetical protein JCM19232_4731 [Vibrio ishigakensis]